LCAAFTIGDADATCSDVGGVLMVEVPPRLIEPDTGTIHGWGGGVSTAADVTPNMRRAISPAIAATMRARR
jgi:hypothetical protein